MFSELEALNSVRALFNAVGHFHRRYAFTGRASDGATTTGLAAGYIWVRPQDGGETRAKNVGAVSVAISGTPVEIGENTRTGELEVLRVAPEAVEILGAALTNRASLPDVDADYATSVIPADLLQDLRLRAPDTDHAGLVVALEAGRTEAGYRYKLHSDDLSAYLPPTAGMRWWVLAYLDGDNALRFSVTGSTETAMAARDMLNAPGVLDALVDAIPDGSYPLAGFILENGQTAVTAANTLFKDARFHFAMKGLQPPGWTLTQDTTLAAGHDFTVTGAINVSSYSLTVLGSLAIL